MKNTSMPMPPQDSSGINPGIEERSEDPVEGFSSSLGSTLPGVRVLGVEVPPESESVVDVDFARYTEQYLEEFFARPQIGDSIIPAEKTAKYKEIFSRFITSNFDKGKVINNPFPEQRTYNPILGEFAGILTSLDHNSGVLLWR
jgi:hypothetical protein